METCRRLKIPIRDYLGSILPGLANFPINRIAELTPAAWLEIDRPNPVEQPATINRVLVRRAQYMSEKDAIQIGYVPANGTGE